MKTAAHIFAFSSLLILSFPTSAINKCIDSNGKVTFTDSACPSATKSRATVSPDLNANVLDSTSIRQAIAEDQQKQRDLQIKNELEEIEERRRQAAEDYNDQRKLLADNCIKEIRSVLNSDVSVGRKGEIIASLASRCNSVEVVEYAKQRIDRLDMSPGRKAKLLAEMTACRNEMERGIRCTPYTTKREPGAVNPRTGEYYPEVEGGVINPRTGEFMPETEGGFVNPSTGEFFPYIE